MKMCSVCGQTKTLLEFNKNPKGKFGVRSNCKECQKLVTNAWYAANKQRKHERAKVWRSLNPHKIKRYPRNEYMKRRRQEDLNFKLRCVIRERLTKLVRNKRRSSLLVLGCSIDYLREYLESKFQPGMAWSNYGKNGWHIDHIKPLASFDLSDERQLEEACHYSNLQPLWATDNLRKGARSMLK